MSTSKLRYFAATMAAVAAVIYFLIAAKVLPVVEVMDNGITFFGLAAGLGFALGAVLLLTVKRRMVWILGALLQVFAIGMYFAVGASRTPNFEVWGLVLRAPQALILVTLAYLSLIRLPARAKPAVAAN